MVMKCLKEDRAVGDDNTSAQRITVFTIGFAKKSAREFFATLEKAGVRRVVDVRLNNVSQLAGFTKRRDLEFFLDRISDIGYVHVAECAPTKEILDAYRKNKIPWAVYESRFVTVMADRRIESILTPDQMDRACLLCSEPTPEKCHRRLVAEYLQSKWGRTDITHL